MANPRRSSSQFHQQQNPIIPLSDQSQQTLPPISISSIAVFLKRPLSLPFLLSILILLTWISLRFHQSPFSSSSPSSQTLAGARSADADANLVRFSSLEAPSLIAGDRRGWLLDPIAIAQQAGVHGGALSCASLHVGEIRSGRIRGNHRHHSCNETFIIWGAETKFRLENSNLKDLGYAEVTVGVDEVAIAASPAGTAHALINIDRVRSTFFLGCQDCVIEHNNSTTDYKVWKNL